jgi:hypothetical protein
LTTEISIEMPEYNFFEQNCTDYFIKLELHVIKYLSPKSAYAALGIAGRT